MNCVERLTTNCLPVSPTTENMCCMSFFLPSRSHHWTITYGRASITSNFLIKLVISQTAILCSACYFSKLTDVPSSRIILILFHSSIHLSSSHTFKYCTLCVLTEFNKIHDDDDDSLVPYARGRLQSKTSLLCHFCVTSVWHWHQW